MTVGEALAALTTPPASDVTYNLARPLVAAWLNVSAGNPATCIAGVVTEATAWLLYHPVGSGVGGGDAAWAQIVGVAGTLDDYNNGLLCAESRDGSGAGSGGGGSGGPGAAVPPDDDTTKPEPPGRGRGGGPPDGPPGRGRRK